jgi:hypothetical protein
VDTKRNRTAEKLWQLLYRFRESQHEVDTARPPTPRSLYVVVFQSKPSIEGTPAIYSNWFHFMFDQIIRMVSLIRWKQCVHKKRIGKRRPGMPCSAGPEPERAVTGEPRRGGGRSQVQQRCRIPSTETPGIRYEGLQFHGRGGGSEQVRGRRRMPQPASISLAPSLVVSSPPSSSFECGLEEK